MESASCPRLKAARVAFVDSGPSCQFIPRWVLDLDSLRTLGLGPYQERVYLLGLFLPGGLTSGRNMRLLLATSSVGPRFTRKGDRHSPMH